MSLPDTSASGPMPSSTSAPAVAREEGFTDFTDIDGFLRIPRIVSLAAGPEGRIVAAISQADEHGARMVSTLYELDPEGQAPARRLTASEKGESSPRFRADGTLLFTSARPDPESGAEADAPALWCLPERGEARVLAQAAGGLGILQVADDGSVLAATSVLPGQDLAGDAEARTARKDARRTSIWHTGMPIRAWDHEVDDESPRLVLISPDGELTDLAEDAGTLGLRGADADLSADATTIVTTWSERIPGGGTRTSIHRIDAASRERTVLLAGDDQSEYAGPVLSPDASRLAVLRCTPSSPTSTSLSFLEIHDLVTGTGPVTAQLGDLTPGEYLWTRTGELLVAGDLHSSGAILAVDPIDGTARIVAEDGVFSSLAPRPDGSLAVLRSDIATPARPVLLDSRVVSPGTAADGSGSGAEPTGGTAAPPRELPAPGTVTELPGTLERVSTQVGDVEVGGWLCLPRDASAARPVPVMLWIHGGPHGSYNAWSWRWCPWLAVARGYAVLMPDPAMSTGYGHAGLNRGWPRRPDVVYAECEALLDLALERDDLDGTRTALLGASFGGFMANWIAGRTDRFDAIVTHAGLWALPQQHRTTDAAAGKMRVHGHEEDESGPAQWYRDFSPHRAIARVRTPMLVTHGNRDYRVPISEALRLWWDLVSTWDGDPAGMPHRFLQLTSENHWVLTPSNALVWNRAVLAFCDQHVLGAEPIPDVLPWG
ncbi:S9 family peptidase [Brachybacterium hainanense]|uniref:Alpha/beta fold hydrolase n=1 Tax=Brachybacterium hainanense TaxID=1541174 RepID=A0ABV6RGT0_9MICO